MYQGHSSTLNTLYENFKYPYFASLAIVGELVGFSVQTKMFQMIAFLADICTGKIKESRNNDFL